MREIIGGRESLKELYSHVLDDSHLSPKYRTIHKYGCSISIPQPKVYEHNEACLKFATFLKMTPRIKYIDIPYHFFRYKVAN